MGRDMGMDTRAYLSLSIKPQDASSLEPGPASRLAPGVLTRECAGIATIAKSLGGVLGALDAARLGLGGCRRSADGLQTVCQGAHIPLSSGKALPTPV